MKLKIDKSLVPIKAHFFFFFAALGPILPQLNVYGKQLGVSAGAMGLVTAILPLLWALAKPLLGYVVDYWPAHRKLVFMLLITLMSGSYCCLWFLPMPEPSISEAVVENVYELNDTIHLKTIDDETLEKFKCHWNCSDAVRFDVYLSNVTRIDTIYVNVSVRNDSCSLLNMEHDGFADNEVVCAPKVGCNLLCYEDDVRLSELHAKLNRSKEEVYGATDNNGSDVIGRQFNLTHSEETSSRFYTTAAFWGFVVLICIGTVAFNVANCIGDAVCFDVLGPEHGSKYGAQRAWGTAGYGLTALAGGWLIDMVSPGLYKDFTPAFVIVLAATAVDLYSCRALNLPSLTSPEDSGKALRQVLKIPRVVVFIVFAVVAGTFDSFIIYYAFWFVEELAEQTGHTAKIKLIEGVVIAAQSFVGELLFFFFSGKIIKRWGYGTTMTVSLFCYCIRMVLISVIQDPWDLVYVEGIMQGPTYALCYSCIVGYAAHVAPEGYSATVQGIVAGMDDGLGFAIGSLLGGQLYDWLGGRGSFRFFAGVAAVGAALHALLYITISRRKENIPQAPKSQEEGVKMLPEIHTNAIYKDTVEPLNEDR